MKIVHVDTGVELRGGQRQLLLLADGLRRGGHEQLIVCPDGSALEVRARGAGFGVFALPTHDPGHAHGALVLRQHLAGERFDIVHAHDGRGQTIAWTATLGMPVRRLASRRVTFLPGGLSSRLRLHRLKYSLTCHSVVAISRFVRDLLVGSGVPQAKIEVIPDGIEIPEQLPGHDVRARVREAWGLGEQDFVIGHAGAFTWEKGQDLAIEAVTLLKERLPEARLLLVGPVPDRAFEQIRGVLERAGDRVRLLGYLEDLSEFFAGLDLYLMPSRAEGLGSSALQAMAHGLPVVASRVGGLPEVVEESKTGWLVPASPGEPASAAALADVMTSAFADRRRLAEFCLRGRERARQFSSDIMISRTEALYQRMVGTTARGGRS
jgi:glycosyltransferase involved in cell wall biosynthesis